jgi:hypothetical protein
VIEYEIVEANDTITKKIVGIEQTSPRHCDLVAALQFQLARDPVSHSTRVPGFESLVFADWTSAGFPELPRLLFWYVIEGRKVIIHDVWVLEEQAED